MRAFTVLSIVLMLCAAACGIQKPDDPADPGYQDIPAIVTDPAFTDGPFRSPASCVWDFNSQYVSGAVCGEVRGTLPGSSWDNGPHIANPDGDGWMGMSYDVPDGTYTLSYLGFQNCGNSTPNEAWAQFGGQDQLLAMSSDDRAFISCNWWDADNQQLLDVDSPSCSIRVTVTNCVIEPAGNMRNFHL